jgi:hypothetical protein
MKSLKTVLLGTAAGILATGVAQAADLPVKKAAAVQYVEVCPVYGAGFYKLPGTDICIRHFGSMKFGFGFQDERSAYYAEDHAFSARAGASNTVGWEYTIRPGWDFRSPTEYGTLRTVVQLRVDQRNGIFQDDDPAMTGTMRVSNIIHRGYIEWAGFVIGRAGTNFVWWDQDDVIGAIGGSPKTTAMQLTYVANIPGGMKATIGLEDTSAWTVGVIDLAHPSSGGNLTFGPSRAFDVIASLSTEQSWGAAKIAGAAHQIVAAQDSIPGGLGAQDTHKIGWGYAALAGITFNLPMLGAKDQLLLETTWSKGAIAYSGINAGADNNTTSFERVGQYLDGLQRNDVDAYMVTDTSQSWHYEMTKVFTVAGQLRHYWAPLWRSNLMASYRKINTPDAAHAQNAIQGGLGDAKAWDVAANLIWGQSRKTAEIGVEVMYKSVKQDLSANTVLPPNVDQNPAGWGVMGIIQRNW